MTENKDVFFIRHIGHTIYKVRVHLSENAKETAYEKVKRLILKDTENYIRKAS